MRVLCTLPNAAETINGIAFTPTDSGMLSDEISDDAARLLASIPGYQLVGAPESAPSRLSQDDAESAPAPRRTSRARKTQEAV